VGRTGAPRGAGRPWLPAASLTCWNLGGRFKAKLWLCEEHPLSLCEQVAPIIDLMAVSNALFAKLRDFITLRLPPGFPVKIGENNCHTRTHMHTRTHTPLFPSALYFLGGEGVGEEEGVTGFR
jgi:hypothetical protein